MAVRQLQCTLGKVALIDEADYSLVSQFSWHTARRGSKLRPATWVMRDGKRRRLTLHRLLINDASLVDHANGDTFDNRRDNLRPCSIAQNNQNAAKRAGTASKFKGVSPYKDKFQVQIQANGLKQTRRAKSEIEAAHIYDELAREMHGAFACLNFPQPHERGAL